MSHTAHFILIVYMSHTTNRGGAGSTLLGIQIAEAVEAIGKVFTRGEALARELLLTASTQEAVLMPWLVMVGHAPSGDWLRGSDKGVMSYIILFIQCKMLHSGSYLLAVHTLQCKLFLVAGHAVVIVVLRNEALGSNRLLTALAAKAGLVPAVPLMLHLPGAWKNREKCRQTSKYYINWLDNSKDGL